MSKCLGEYRFDVFEYFKVFLINIAFQVSVLADELPETLDVEANESDITDCFETALVDFGGM